MNSGPLLFLGIVLTFLSAWLGLVLAPYLIYAGAEPVSTVDGEPYPVALGGLAAEGREVYISYGCIYCHSQQVRPQGFGADIERGWGDRRTVPQDYLYDKPHLLGSMRTGPDLANIGVRQPDDNWHHLHLYNPRSVSPGSIMPAFRFLYEIQEVVGEPSSDALQLPEDFEPAPPPGYEIVPGPDAKALVAYLKSLNKSVEFSDDAGE